MAISTRAPALPVAGSAFDAFYALVLDDLSLQHMLRQTADTDRFIVSLVDAASARGYRLVEEEVRAAMGGPLPAIADAAGTAIRETRPPPAGWLPIRASWQRGELYVHWAYFGDRRLREPFFEGDARISQFEPFGRLFQYVTPIEALAGWLDTCPHLQPSGLIFHMSRCGSTLVSQMLAASPSNIVVSEASPIDAVVQARLRRPDLDEDRQARWLTSIIGVLGQQRWGSERHYVIKLDCWHTAALPLFRRAFPDVPWVFLYRDPVEVLMSQLRMPGSQMLADGIGPNLYGIECCYGPGRAEDYYARVLARVCEPVAQHAAAGGLLVNYQQLPDAVFTAILPHFGMQCSAAHRAAMTEAARYNAKTPGFTFAPDSDAKQQAATPSVRAATDRWLADLYRRFEHLRAGG
jgi:hypothetical protein